MPRPLTAASMLARLIPLAAMPLILALLAPGRAEAAPSCTSSVTDGTFTATSGLSPGTYDTTATLSFSCTGLTPAIPVTLCPNIDGGSGGGDAGGGRFLTGSGLGSLGFQIYRDAGRTLPWGSTSFLIFGDVPTITVTPGANGRVDTTRTLYARVTVPATAKPGTYSSTFTNQNFFWGLNLLTCGGITVGFALPPPAFTFRMTIDPGCTVAGTPMDFGTVGLLATTKVAENSVNVRCTNGTTYSVGLGNGLNGTSPTNRRLAKGAERITYGIYKDRDGVQPWGEAAMGASFVQAGTGTGSSQPYPAYGRAPAQTTPSPGAYSDTIVATVTY